jgi:subfamily B ATP-binding cassette protein MsbA
MKNLRNHKNILIRYGSRYPILVILNIVLGFSSALFNGIGTVLLVPLMIGFLGNSVKFPETIPLLNKMIGVFEFFPENQRSLVMFITVFILIILKNLANYLNTLSATYFSLALNRDMKLDAMNILLSVDLDFYAKNKIGDLVNRCLSEPVRVINTIKSYINLLTNSITILIFLSVLLSLSWTITVCATLALIILALLNQFLIKKSRYLGQKISEVAQELTNKLIEIITGIRLIKSVGQEKYEAESMNHLVYKREKVALDSQKISAIISPLNEIGGIIVILLIIIIGRYVFSTDLDAFAAVLLTYLLVLSRMLPFVSQLNSIRNGISGNTAAVDLVTNFLRRDDKPIMSSGKKIFSGLQKGIQLENLVFAYPEHEEIVLKGIDLWIPEGKMTALVGASGAGKSTIADLVPRFYDPTQGRITADGVDLRDYDLPSLRSYMGIVSQETYLFNNSVRYNIGYGVPNATDEEIIAAARRANAYEFITKLPEGLDTELGDRGVRLSGGQRQRIAISRALLRNPSILILDEATSALDTVSEKLVQQAIDELCQNRTTIVIAHRLSTVQKADQIVVLDRGKIVEIGTHQELLEKNGQYANLYNMQFSDNKQSPELPNSGLITREDAQVYSYEIRSKLNALVGSLRLLYDGLIDDPVEEKELLEESCDSATQLIETLQYFEKAK